MKDPRELAILQAGAELRANTIGHYQSLGDRLGDQLARRMVFEIGHGVKLARGTREESAILYAAADALSADIPVDDFRLPPAAVAIQGACSGGDTGRLGFIARQRAWLNQHGAVLLAGIWIGLILGGLVR